MAGTSPNDRVDNAPPANRRRERGTLRLTPRVQRSRPSRRAWLIAGGVHLVLGFVLLRVLTFGHGWADFFRWQDDAGPTERITYVERTPERVPEKAPEPPQREERPQPQQRQAAQPTPPAPSTGPVLGTGGAPTPVTRPDTGGGAGAVSALGNPAPELRGVAPTYSDPRVWGAVPGGVATQRTGADRLDSIISYAITTAADSLDAIARRNGEGGRQPGDWTVRGANGEKWGWDQQGIRLGKVTIPNALLGLLPMNVQQAMSANPTAVDRERRLAMAREDIRNFSQRAIGEAEFRKLVKELRERKEREHQEKQKTRSEQTRIIGGGNER